MNISQNLMRDDTLPLAHVSNRHAIITHEAKNLMRD